MYLVGSDHPHKTDCRLLLERLVASEERLVTDAEVLQEITHRYVAIGRREAIAPAHQVLMQLVDEVFPIDKGLALRAAQIAVSTKGVSSRDALHIAAMEQHKVSTILTFDKGFDNWPGLRRLHRL